jgi:hypothetical protein
MDKRRPIIYKINLYLQIESLDEAKVGFIGDFYSKIELPIDR